MSLIQYQARVRRALPGILILCACLCGSAARADVPASPASPATPASPPSDSNTGKWQHVVGILQYLAGDYPDAVESGLDTELAEQRAFIHEAISALDELGPSAAAFRPRMESIQARINQGADPQGVSRDCPGLIEDLVLAGGLARSPHRAPDLAHGKEVYAKACAACHAQDGSGHVAIAATMQPKPANFLDAEVMAGLSPYKAFNTIGFGVTGTAMPSFASALDEKDRWALAFYIASLRHQANGCHGEVPHVSVERLATSTDVELEKEFGADAVACLRLKPPSPSEEELLINARAQVEKAIDLAAAGDSMGARQALLDSYLNGVEPVESLLRSRDPGVVTDIEQAVLRMRVAIEQHSPHARDEGRELLSLIDRARRASANNSPWAVAAIAFLILLREGFEALVVIAALLAVLKRMKAESAARVVHAGWSSALVLGIAAFIFGQHLLAGADREWVEGLVALVAVAMLLYAALWLNKRSNISAFMKELRTQMEGAIGSGSMAGLFLISFSSVGRETFETALFMQGLSVDSRVGTAWGAGIGLLVMAGLVVMVSRVGYRLPMKTLFSGSTILLFATAVVLLGKGLHALQLVGALPIHRIPMFTVDVLGIYPDLVSLIPQLVLALAPFAWKAVQRLRRPQTPPTVGGQVAPGGDR